jgi:hypothetical protein
MIVGLSNLVGGVRAPDPIPYCQIASQDKLMVSGVFEGAPEEDSLVWAVYSGDNSFIRCASNPNSLIQLGWQRAYEFTAKQTMADAQKLESTVNEALATVLVVAQNSPQGRGVRWGMWSVAALAAGIGYLCFETTRPKPTDKAVPEEVAKPRTPIEEDPCHALIMQAAALYCQLHQLVSNDPDLTWFISEVSQGNHPTYRGDPAKAMKAHLILNNIAELVHRISLIPGCQARLQEFLRTFDPPRHCIGR